MDDLFKKFLNTSVGFIAQGNKAMQAAIEKLVKESKLSEKEGKKIVADLMKSGEAKRADYEKQFMGLTDSLRERVGLGADNKKKAAPASKTTAAKPTAKPAAKKPATSATAKVAGTVKKAAASVSASADTAKRSAAAKAGAAKKKEAAEAKS